MEEEEEEESLTPEERPSIDLFIKDWLIMKRALKHIFRINSEVPGNGSFCEELSNDPSWLQIAKSKWFAKENFEAYSHGRDIQQVLQESSAATNRLPNDRNMPIL
ncbi:hypothetical protein PGTUg99_000086 [Puccinia graminis f. sp. tritici]|uniref:Uncharacterized protein n=1 Tax=Puccinia graminis f. sp. tritici TaxID=56615 RepID=A0A5B0RJ88_PUCGR|nr:hypothetical protein PGTUg99_000086 [Puccinia graminis f. sp. tritici]